MPNEDLEELEMVMVSVALARIVAVDDFDSLHLLQVGIVETIVPISSVAQEATKGSINLTTLGT